jgi:hypothetical protein
VQETSLSTAQSLVFTQKNQEVVQVTQLAPHQTEYKVKTESFVDGGSIL